MGGEGRPAWCVRCHAPSGGKGLVCADCHGNGPHPYPKLLTPDVCARCHDARGESAGRRFLAGPAARRGEDCLSCHISEAPPGADHAFQGRSVPGFLEGVAGIRMFLRGSGPEDRVAVLQVQHQAGHALPRGPPADPSGYWWRETVRFGWENHPDRGRIDRTLPPGRPAVIELTQLRRGGAVMLSVGLWYRFLPARAVLWPGSSGSPIRSGAGRALTIGAHRPRMNLVRQRHLFIAKLPVSV